MPEFAPPRVIGPLEMLAIREGRYPVTRFLLTGSAPRELHQPDEPTDAHASAVEEATGDDPAI